MNLETYLASNAGTGSTLPAQFVPPDAAAHSLDDLILQQSAILAHKLDIPGAEIWWRLHVSSRNLTALADDRDHVQDLLDRLHVAANYHLREHQEKGVLYRKLFELETEQRSERVECWRDVVMVMRDFLEVWEAHEQARAKAIFIQNVGTGIEGDL